MTIGIIGAGHIGQAVAKRLSSAGLEASISNSRGPESLSSLVRELGPGIKAATRQDAATADIVFLCRAVDEPHRCRVRPAAVERPHRDRCHERGSSVPTASQRSILAVGRRARWSPNICRVLAWSRRSTR